MNKQLKLTMEDGSVWVIPAEVIATNRAIYYMNKEGKDEADKARILEEETKIALEDPDDIRKKKLEPTTLEQIVEAGVLVSSNGDSAYVAGIRGSGAIYAGELQRSLNELREREVRYSTSLLTKYEDATPII